MKFTLGATVPVMSYGNIQPLIEVEAESYEAAMAIAEKYIKDIWNRYGEKPLPESSLVRLTDIFGNEIDYDPVKHEYWWQGVRYISGSEYAKQFETPFDAAAISDRMSKGDKVKQQALLDQWELNAEVSRGFGTALHGALELFGKYGKLHAHPVIEKAVKEFYASHPEKAQYECLVVDHKNKRAGRIDRLVDGRVQDFKSNANIDKSLPVYWKQLEFYAGICHANGRPITGVDIFHWNGKWQEYNKELK